jgi:hypothetical protein
MGCGRVDRRCSRRRLPGRPAQERPHRLGKDYPLSIGGISLGATIGVSKAEFVGDVFNLSAPEDIEGVYSGAKAGLAIAGGAKTAVLKNSKGVELKVSGEQIGVELTLDLNGMDVRLKK